MSCPITLSGVLKDCKVAGGLSEIYIVDYNDVVRSGITFSGSTGIISNLTMSSGKKFKTYQMDKNTGSLTTTATISNAATSFKNDVAFSLGKLSAAKRLEFEALASGYVYVMVLDNTGTYYLLGYNHPVEMTAGTAASGAALTDESKYTITLSEDTTHLPYVVETTTAKAALDANAK